MIPVWFSLRQFVFALLLFSILLCFSAYQYGQREEALVTTGARTAWRELPVPESEAFDLFTTSWGNTVYLTTPTQTLRCTWHLDTCEHVTYHPNDAGPYQACDYDSAAFSVASVPSTVASCHYLQLVADNGLTDTFTVFDNSNRLWVWSHSPSSSLFSDISLGTVYGLMAAVFSVAMFAVVGIIQAILRWLNARESHAV